MLNDRDDKYDSEDSEYHFTDEDVSYEIETESPKTTPVSGGAGNLLNRLGQSKRMLISLGVFLVLIFVVYKMVSPSATTPRTDIAPPVVAQPTNQSAAPMQANMAPSAPAMTNPAPVAQAAPPQQPAMPSQPVVAAAQQQSVAAPEPAQTAAPSAPAIMVQQTMPQQPVATPEPTQAAATPTMPAMIPVQSAIPPAQAQQPVNTPVAPAESPMAAMVNQNEKVITQLQADYTQKISDYAAQNKELQEQMQSLNSRVASMEGQMSQLVQAITRQTQASSQPQSQPAANNDGAPTPQPSQPPAVNDTRVSANYSVQAIIPGRAWLRSDSGEAVTVAEGDMIKDLGRVTKIDPYDGVVEINTGSKIVSLSYGNGG